eukprot:403377293
MIHSNNNESSQAFGDGEAYKRQVEEAKKKLRKQIAVLILMSFIVSLAVFLIFFWIIKV